MAPFAAGQGCLGADETFFKNDNLADVPSLAGVALIRGLCPGEAAGCVFDTGGPAYVNQVAVMFAQAAGAAGAVAAVDVEIYDGVTETAGVYTLGPRVFSLSNDLGANLQLTSHAINTYDLPTPVQTMSDKIAVIFPMLLNTNGDCNDLITGQTANFATDNSPCTPANYGKNIMYVSGPITPGYYDPQQLSISGFNLCQFNFYTGNWIIRACITPDIRLTWTGNPTPSPGDFLILDAQDPANPNTPFVIMMSSSIGTGFDFSSIWPNTLPMQLDLNPWWNCFMGPCRAAFLNGGAGVLDANGEGSDVFQIPTGTLFSGLTLYGAFFTYDPGDFFTWHSMSPPSAPIPIQ